MKSRSECSFEPRPTFPTSVLAQPPQFPFMHHDCEVWDVPTDPADQRQVSRDPVPILVISGSYDALTSPVTARRVADALTRSTFVIIPRFGHFVRRPQRAGKKGYLVHANR